MLPSSSHPTLPETYTVRFEITAWAVVEASQTDAHKRSGNRQKTGRGGKAPGTLLMVFFGMAMGRKKHGGGANKGPLKCHFWLSRNEASGVAVSGRPVSYGTRYLKLDRCDGAL